MVNLSARRMLSVFALGSINALAQSDYPSVGLLYNTSEKHSLTYRCQPPVNGRLICNFEQVAVRQKASIQDLVRNIEAARKQFSAKDVPSRDECVAYRELASILDGTKKAPKAEAFDAVSVIEKRDMVMGTKLLLELCAKPSQETFVNVVRYEQEKNRRTCLVSVNSYQQSFTRLSTGGALASWVVESKPDGVCGIVQLTRFDAEEMGQGKSAIPFWKYISRKAITNPSGDLPLFGKCSALDEGTYVFDWRAKTHQQTCDYIEFSPL